MMHNVTRTLLLLGALLITRRPGSVQAQAPAFDRAITCASSAGGYTSGPQQVAVDRQGNTLAAGVFSGTVLIGTTLLTSAGTGGGPTNPAPADVFVAKLDAAGNYAWAVQATGALWEGVAGIAVDAAGDVYVTGYFESYSVAFGGITLFNSSARAEAYVAKLNGATGQWLWARRCGGGNHEYPAAVAVSAQGEVYIAGRSDSMTPDFGPFTLTNGPYGGAFIAKLSATGAWVWARPAGSGQPRISGMVLDAQGGIYLAGSFYAGTVSFGGIALMTRELGTPTTTSTDYGRDIFIAKLDDAGAWQWAVQGDPNGQNLIYSTAVSLDGLGHVYVAGDYGWIAVRMGGVTLPNQSNMTSNPGAPAGQVVYRSDAYAARLNAATGAWEWVIRAGGLQGDGFSSIAADGQGRVYVAGSIDNPLPGGGQVHVGQLDGGTGAWRWTLPRPGSAPQQLVLDAAGRVTLAGVFRGPTATFGPATLAQEGGPGGTTGYLARLGAGPLATRAAGAAAGLAVWPNPAGSGLVRVQGPAAGQWVQVFDALGRRVCAGQMPPSGPLVLPLPPGLPAGLYVVRGGVVARPLVVE